MARERIQFGLATIVMLVLLRLSIGWHFFSEGAKHYTDPNWSSEAFLRSAKGPLAPHYQSVLSDFYGWEKWLHGSPEVPDPAAVGTEGVKEAWEKFRKPLGTELEPWQEDAARRMFYWYLTATRHWDAYQRRFADAYQMEQKQREAAALAIARRKSQLEGWIGDNFDDLSTHIHEWQRLGRWRSDATAENLPFQKRRVADKQAALAAEAGGWLAQVKGIERDYKNDLRSQLDWQQRELPGIPEDDSTLATIDAVMTYGILGIGVCLSVGLFTRLASLLGALFLLSVIMTQPFWLSDAQPTFNQIVEMFALLTLATTPVGRWGGLDFFIHHLLVRPCCSTKGKSDAPNS